MLSRTAILSTLLFSLCAAACTRTPAPPTPVAEDTTATGTSTGTGGEAIVGQPKIAADEATFDFGALKLGQTVDHTFTIKNLGDADLHIDRVQKT